MKITVSKSFYPLFENRDRYLVMVGGRGSGKSEFAARKLFVRCMKEGGHRFLVLRKVRRRVEESCLELFLRLLRENDVPFLLNQSKFTLEFSGPGVKGSEILFDGLDDSEKIKSIKGLTGIWLEETTEFTENDFFTIDLCLREPGPNYHQILMSFNPDEAAGPWIKEKFFWSDEIHTGPGKLTGSYVHHSTVDDNPSEFVRKQYVQILDELIHQNETLYKINRLGFWALARGVIYPNWDVQPLPKDVKFDSIVYGLDFGYSVDPAVLIKIYRKADEYWIEELIYEKGLTNQDLARRIKSHHGYDIDTGIIYADSSEPKSIEELCREEVLVKPANKGQDSVRSGIDFVKSRTVHMLPEAVHTQKERKSYLWKEDKEGRPLPEPVAYENHCMDATRYGIVTDYQEGMGDVDFIVLG